ncbi:hypothetical protein, partial [Escherichia coli]|uniref:hypothetical protein n=1 Tax=Escherichia coli TaxID=562 RepID=UPI001954E8BA
VEGVRRGIDREAQLVGQVQPVVAVGHGQLSGRSYQRRIMRQRIELRKIELCIAAIRNFNCTQLNCLQ